MAKSIGVGKVNPGKGRIVTIINHRASKPGGNCLRGERRSRQIGPDRLIPALSLVSVLFAGCSFPPTQIETQHASYIAHSEPHELCQSPDDRILSSIVRVATGDGADASGVVVAGNRVLTAAHVVDDTNLALVHVDNGYRKAEVIALDPSLDLALLAVDTGKLQPLRLTSLDLYDYERVWAVGFPLALDQVTTRGFFRSESDGRLFTSAPIDAGASGGGLMRCREGVFELAGVIRGYGGYWSGGELIPLHNLSIHTPAEQIQRFVLRTDGTIL